MAKENEIDKILGRITRELLQEKGISQEKLAELGNFERSYISKIENAKRSIQVTTFIRFANALDVKPSELMGKLESMIYENPIQ